jgi:glucokinase
MMSIYLGIDLGGTKIAAGILDTAGARSTTRIVATEAHEGPDAVLQRMIALAHDACAAAGVKVSDLAAVGVGVPGLFDAATGATRFLPNLAGAWRGVPVGATLGGALGCPIRLINDARAFVLAEARHGAGQGAATVVGLTIGTGVGGGIVIGGRLHLGLDGTAGEAGHTTIEPYGVVCGCGNRGCLETIVSGPAIAAAGVRAMLQGVTSRIGALAGGDLRAVTPQTIRAAAEEGDAVAREILLRAGAGLGQGIANLVTLLSPERVVIGGSVAQLGAWLLEPAEAEMRRRCHVTPLDRVAIVPAVLGGDAGVVGAALWAAQD